MTSPEIYISHEASPYRRSNAREEGTAWYFSRRSASMNSSGSATASSSVLLDRHDPRLWVRDLIGQLARSGC